MTANQAQVDPSAGDNRLNLGISTDFAIEYAAGLIQESPDPLDREWLPGTEACVTHTFPREFTFKVTEGSVTTEALGLIEHILTRPVEETTS